MSYSISFPVNDTQLMFGIENDTLPGLLAEYAKIGGTAEITPALLKASLGAALERPVPVVAPVVAEVQAAKQAAQPADPWADEAPPADEPPADDDPWGAPATPTQTAKPSSAPSSPAPGASSSASPDSTRDNLGRLWQLNLPEAPTCDCGLAAGKMHGVSQKTHKKYVVWKCPKAVGDDWKSKCEFSEFPD